MRVLVWALLLASVAAGSAAYACPMHGDKHPVIAESQGTSLPQTPAPVRLPVDKKS